MEQSSRKSRCLATEIQSWTFSWASSSSSHQLPGKPCFSSGLPSPYFWGQRRSQQQLQGLEWDSGVQVCFHFIRPNMEKKSGSQSGYFLRQVRWLLKRRRRRPKISHIVSNKKNPGELVQSKMPKKFNSIRKKFNSMFNSMFNSTLFTSTSTPFLTFSIYFPESKWVCLEVFSVVFECFYALLWRSTWLVNVFFVTFDLFWPFLSHFWPYLRL